MKNIKKAILNSTTISFLFSFIVNCVLFSVFLPNYSLLEKAFGIAISTLAGGITILAFYAMFLSIIESIKCQKNNKKYIKEHGLKLRMRCLDCKHCKWFYYHPFYKYGKYGNVMVQKLPKYCRFIKKELKPKYDLRCQIPKAEIAMWEKD